MVFAFSQGQIGKFYNLKAELWRCDKSQYTLFCSKMFLWFWRIRNWSAVNVSKQLNFCHGIFFLFCLCSICYRNACYVFLYINWYRYTLKVVGKLKIRWTYGLLFMSTQYFTMLASMHTTVSQSVIQLYSH